MDTTLKLSESLFNNLFINWNKTFALPRDNS